tara:strand:- start:4537 stop:5439 length:903 start_codon:yes stop_codon:yes gene_type:complete
MKLSKNLITVKKCPICQNKKFIDQGKVNGVHHDLKNFCNLLRCINCKHLFLSKMPKHNFLKKLYRSKSLYVFGVFGKDHTKNVKKNLKSNNYVLNHWIYKEMKNKKKGNYLEVGPGACTLLKTFKKNGWKCQGFELSNWIKSKDVVHNMNKIKKGNKEVLVFNDVLEHTVDPLSFLKKFSKLQKTGDRLFLSYPNASSFMAKILKTKWSMIAPLAHLNFFSIDSTKILLKKSGYHPLVIRETSLVIFKKLLRHIVRLPITLTLDLLNLRFLNALKRILEIILNILDLIKGDQINVIGVKK